MLRATAAATPSNALPGLCCVVVFRGFHMSTVEFRTFSIMFVPAPSPLALQIIAELRGLSEVFHGAMVPRCTRHEYAFCTAPLDSRSRLTGSAIIPRRVWLWDSVRDDVHSL